MENNGEGQLTMGPLDIVQWTPIGDKEGYATKEEITKLKTIFISTLNSSYGLCSELKRAKNIVFTDTESNGRYFLWYRQIDESPEKQTL